MSQIHIFKKDNYLFANLTELVEEYEEKNTSKQDIKKIIKHIKHLSTVKKKLPGEIELITNQNKIYLKGITSVPENILKMKTMEIYFILIETIEDEIVRINMYKDLICYK